MASVEFEKVLKKTVGPGKIRESLVGSRKFCEIRVRVLVLVGDCFASWDQIRILC